MPTRDPPSARHRLRWTATLFLLLLAAAWSLWGTATDAVPAWLGVASLVLGVLAGTLALPGRGAVNEEEADSPSRRPEGNDEPTDSVPADSVPAAVAASPTLTALWRRGRESGRDEIALAVDGLRDAGSRSVAGMRDALAEGRPEGAVICARSLAGLASMLGRSELHRLCRELADEIERSKSRAEEPEGRVDEIETALDQAVAELRRIWPLASRA